MSSDYKYYIYTSPPFWTVRPPTGIQLGTNFITTFREDIRTMLDAGNVENLQKLSAGQMQEKLQYAYPHRFDIPSTYQIGIPIIKLKLYNEL